MIPPPSVSRLWAGGIFDHPHLLAFLDFYFFYYSHRLRTRTLLFFHSTSCYEKNKRAQGPSPSAPNKSLLTIVPPHF